MFTESLSGLAKAGFGAAPWLGDGKRLRRWESGNLRNAVVNGVVEDCPDGGLGDGIVTTGLRNRRVVQCPHVGDEVKDDRPKGVESLAGKRRIAVAGHHAHSCMLLCREDRMTPLPCGLKPLIILKKR